MIQVLLVTALLASSPGNGYPTQGPLEKATLGCFGDSILAIGNVCSKIEAVIPVGYASFNGAISGETADQIYDRVVSEAPTLCLGEHCGTYFVEGVINTLKSPSYGEDDEEAVEVALEGLGPSVHGLLDSVDWLHAQYPLVEVRALGATPYGACDFATCPVLTNPGERARLFNERLMEACESRPWLRCLDVYEDFEEPHDPGDPHTDQLKEEYRALDGIHLTTLAQDLLGAALAALRSWP